jgi:hypothetical protein
VALGGILSGPITLFDKSALQSLNVDEAVWFDNFYATVITPLFFVETLADLSKEIPKGGNPEQIVGSIAGKTPEIGSFVVVDHRELCVANLDGYRIEMEGRPHISGGQRFQVEGKEGSFYERPPGMRAFERWQKGDFLGIERDFARYWRAALATMDLTSFYPVVRRLGGGRKLRNLEDARALAEQMVIGEGRRYTTLKVAFEMLAVPSELRPQITKRWKQEGGPPLPQFARYAAYNLMVDLFFYLSLDAGLISAQRPSNRVDIAYLYYLPFCMIFTSGDKLHRKITPLFLRNDQVFLWAPDLKADLSRLDAHYDSLPETVKAQGIGHFASRPPVDGDYLTTQLWDKFLLPSWREAVPPRSESMTANIVALGKAIADLEGAEEKLGRSMEAVQKHSDDLDHVVLQRGVHGHRGKWQIVSPGLRNIQPTD